MSVTWNPSIASPQGGSTPPVVAPHADAVLQAVSVLLGVGTGRLQADLAAGQTLQALASSQHVSTNQLVSTLAEALQASNSGLTATQAHLIAAEMAQRSGALQVGAPQAPTLDTSESGSTAAPIGGVGSAPGSSTSTSGPHIDLRL